MSKLKILVVEDDAKIRALLRNVLEADGFVVLEADGPDAARRHIDANEIALVTLDLHLGRDSGLELAREIRRTSALPIIMVTGRDDVIDRVVGLEIGADDYITKPFHVREVIARVHSVLRRTGGDGTAATAAAAAAAQAPQAAPRTLTGAGQETCYRFDEMTAIPDRMEMTDRSGRDCELTSGDFKLLSVFLDRPKRVLSRDQLMTLIGGQEWTPLDRTIDNQIARLRKKIERDPSQPRLIKTVRGVGYMFSCGVTRVQSGAGPAKSA